MEFMFGDFSALSVEEQNKIKVALSSSSPYLKLPWAKPTSVIGTKSPVLKQPEQNNPPSKPSGAWGQTRQWSSLFSPKAPSSAPSITPATAGTTDEVDPNIAALGDLLHKRDGADFQCRRIQPRGLNNRSNWCYINSTLQALLGCQAFVNLLKSLPEEPLPRRGVSALPITDNMVRFIKEFTFLRSQATSGGGKLQELTVGTPFEPSYIYAMLHDLEAKQFALGGQEDAEEFLSCVLNALHEELLTCLRSVPAAGDDTTDVTPGGDDDVTHSASANGYSGSGEPAAVQTADDDEWQQVGPKNKSLYCRKTESGTSPVSEIFGGLLRYALLRPDAKESADVQSFFTLPLDIQPSTVQSVEDALSGLSSRQVIDDYRCPQSNNVVEACRKMSLERLPAVLILHLKRFVYRAEAGGTQKITKHVHFDSNLEITRELLSATARAHTPSADRHYRLTAVQYHAGQAASRGHYTADVLLQAESQVGKRDVWCRFDDSRCSLISEQQVISQNNTASLPYLLYYTRQSKLQRTKQSR